MRRNWRNIDNYMCGKIYPINVDKHYIGYKVHYDTNDGHHVCIDYSCINIDNIIKYIAKDEKVIERQFFTASGAYICTIDREGKKHYGTRPTLY